MPCFYVMNSHDFSVKMEVAEVNNKMLSHLPQIYPNCLDLDSQRYIKSSNLACCWFTMVLGHVSFPNDCKQQ